jgi:ubiquinone/menaquinone biosynthesis C-methylase UbiE
MSTNRLERLQPFRHSAPDSLFNKLKFRARLLADFQVRTVYSHLRRAVPALKGRILDVGCGEMPYKHLVTKADAVYLGIDIQDAEKFGYANPDAISFDGQTISAPNEAFDHLLCTEVLEHVAEPWKLVEEMRRVLKKGGTGILTVPWSARYHYIPFDYHRFTPSALESMFRDFSSVTIEPRGTDLTAIATKIIVVYLRSVRPEGSPASWARAVVASTCTPLVAGVVVLGHLSLAFGWGSTDDPLGYVIHVQK